MKILMLADENTAEFGRLFKGQVVDVPAGLAEDLVYLEVAERWDEPEPDSVARAFVEDDIVRVPEPEYMGGGWYELPDGSRVQGKAAAEEAMQEME